VWRKRRTDGDVGEVPQRVRRVEQHPPIGPHAAPTTNGRGVKSRRQWTLWFGHG
jgi:hypothetical protein